MEEQFSRTELLLGNNAMETLKNSSVLVFGVGGVGGYVVEVLARSGVGTIGIVDDDHVGLSNINRQIIATHSSLGRAKVDVAEERILDINPMCTVRKFQTFYLPEVADKFNFKDYNYVIDCIDTVVAKIDIITRCYNLKIPIISSMGAAFKLDATRFEVTDLFKTINDPLAKILRKKLRKSNVRNIKVVYSPEEPLTSLYPERDKDYSNNTNTETIAHKKRSTPASNAWVPATAGLIIGGEVIQDLCKTAKTMRQIYIEK
ncbi:tRNA threonylcarbamoyladenosine dehydratase [Prevotella pallens]|uniref:tRNA threonylcarbamoyladenosine dehydratase n=1 Tax=Prevotella pallens TaxID=60133 RepID=UPI003C7CFC58